jgi:predicted metal-dependent enzyme (double-stranded beta helix superfamily)
MQFDHDHAGLEAGSEQHATALKQDKLAGFIADFSCLLDAPADEPRILREGGRLLARLVGEDDWLPLAHAVPGAESYRQYLLHRDPGGRFVVVCFVWGPGQATPVHDHTVWGLIGMLRGAEYSQPYRFIARDRLVPAGPALRLEPGRVEAVSPSVGDIHRVYNAYDDRSSISIHVYGADIGAIERGVYTEAGDRRPFVSGYSTLPRTIPPRLP